MQAIVISDMCVLGSFKQIPLLFYSLDHSQTIVSQKHVSNIFAMMAIPGGLLSNVWFGVVRPTSPSTACHAALVPNKSMVGGAVIVSAVQHIPVCVFHDLKDRQQC